MPKLKASEFNFDEDELEEAEYSESDFEDYGGEEPPAGTILSGYVKKMWLSESTAGADMLIVLFVAADNEGELEDYNGWGTLDYQTLQTNTKFKWKPFIDAFGLTLSDIKNKMYTEDEAEARGDVVEKIGTFVPGEESDTAWARVLTKREKYNGEWRGKVGKWLPWDDAEEAAVPEPEPAKARATRAAKPAATKQPAAKPAARRASRAAPAEEPDDDNTTEGEGDEEGGGEEETTPARPTRGGRSSTPAGRSKPSATTGRSRRGGGGSTEAPPF